MDIALYNEIERERKRERGGERENIQLTNCKLNKLKIKFYFQA